MARVFVGLSGGVDSAVSAARLVREGHEVTGCFIKIWQPEFLECSWREDRLDAMRICAALGIPFREVDLSEEYKREVVDSMIIDYTRGITPNPDVLCNRSIKFGHFLRWAEREGADLIATGHYARISRESEIWSLHRGADKDKDQSYFLWQLTEAELSKTLFPIGNLTKTKVRALAKKFALPNAEKPDSQGLCFIGNVSMDEFLARFMKVERGALLDTKGSIIGEHRGAALYTIGERHGFTARGAGKGPQYVVATDVERNMVTVSPRKEDTLRREVTLRDVNWVSKEPVLPATASVQARYREVPAQARIEGNGNTLSVRFEEPHLATPGQSLVLYDTDRCLGGGSIC